MNKFFKILTTMLVVIAIVACIGVFAACNNTDANTDANPDNNGTTNDGGNNGETEGEYTYKFTVVDANGNPIQGVRVQLCQGEENCKLPKTTDANGVVKFFADEEMHNVPADVYDIHVLVEDTDYEDYILQDANQKTSVDVKDYTLILVK